MDLEQAELLIYPVIEILKHILETSDIITRPLQISIYQKYTTIENTEPENHGRRRSLLLFADYPIITYERYTTYSTAATIDINNPTSIQQLELILTDNPTK